MAKPWHIHNRPEQYEGPGDGADKAKEVGEGMGKGGEGREGEERARDNTDPPTEQPANTGRAIRPERGRRCQRQRRRQRKPKRRKRTEAGAETAREQTA